LKGTYSRRFSSRPLTPRVQESFASAIFLAKLILFDFDKYRGLV